MDLSPIKSPSAVYDVIVDLAWHLDIQLWLESRQVVCCPNDDSMGQYSGRSTTLLRRCLGNSRKIRIHSRGRKDDLSDQREDEHPEERHTVLKSLADLLII